MTPDDVVWLFMYSREIKSFLKNRGLKSGEILLFISEDKKYFKNMYTKSG